MHWLVEILPCVDKAGLTVSARIQYKLNLFNSSCPSDKTVRFHNTDGQRQRMSIHAFRYFGNITTVYVHCLVFLCHKASRDNRCHSGCNGNNVKRVRRDLENGPKFASDDGSHSKYYLLEAGPIAVKEEEPRPNNANQGTKNWYLLWCFTNFAQWSSLKFMI